jgi:beta-lactamase regulating signal transducer with metallopeptidase domain
MIGEWLAFQSLSDFAHGVAGEWLVDTLIVTAALMALVLVLRRPVAKHFGAELAYALWAIPLARLFMPPLTRTIEVKVSAPAAPVATEAVESAGSIIPAAMAAPADAMPEPSMVQTLLADADWFAIGVTVWLCGAAIFLIAQLSAYLQNRRELLEDAVEVARIDDIRVIEIAGISGPFAFGLWQRYIALPIGFTRDYNPVERELALAHERSHHRAGDLWANFAALAMLSLHWFNPIAWMAWRAFRFDQEAACDARVLRRRTSAERQAYARAIAKAATGQTLAFASPLNPKDKIVERLKIMKQSETSKGRKWLGGSLIGGGLVTAMAMTATVSYAVQPVEPETPEAPLAPDAPDAPEAPAAPSVKVDDGVYVYTLRRDDGKKVVLRLNRPARQKELDRMAAEAERSRAEADRAIAQADRASAEADRAAAQAEWAAAKAERHSASAITVAPRVIVRSGSAGDSVIELGEGHRLRIQTSDCDGKAKSAAFMTQTETRNGQVTRTKVVTCGQVMPDEAEIAAQIERGMAEGRKSMERARAEIRRNPHLSAEDRAEALRDIDEGLREMRAGLAEARRELRRDMAEARREMSRIPAPPEAPEPPAPPARTW